jgi:hypothetical protein
MSNRELLGRPASCEGCAANIVVGMSGYCRLNYARVIVQSEYGQRTWYAPKGNCPKPINSEQLTLIIDNGIKNI